MGFQIFYHCFLVTSSSLRERVIWLEHQRSIERAPHFIIIMAIRFLVYQPHTTDTRILKRKSKTIVSIGFCILSSRRLFFPICFCFLLVFVLHLVRVWSRSGRWQGNVLILKTTNSIFFSFFYDVVLAIGWFWCVATFMLQCDFFSFCINLRMPLFD